MNEQKVTLDHTLGHINLKCMLKYLTGIFLVWNIVFSVQGPLDVNICGYSILMEIICSEMIKKAVPPDFGFYF